jgi:16S rRNA (cytosine1402-N4)-methyltransferase
MNALEKTYHVPVLLQESIELLITNKDGIYLDATLGGGGHSAVILEKIHSAGRLFGLDQDDEALKEAGDRLGNDERFTAVKGNFGHFDVYLDQKLKGYLTGILLDLGVSSHQIDEGNRGFSFQQDGPLDMRMGNLSGLTAERVINEYELSELKRIFFEYGEERHSNAIAKKIIESRPIRTTFELKKAIRSIVSGKHENKTLARIFQAVRIEVNRELEMLRNVLEKSVEWLAVDGRLVVISYHSLEDRLVKHYMRAGDFSGVIPKDFFGNDLSPFKLITRKPVEATEEEIKLNSRSRSARLRAVELKERGMASDVR